MFILSRSVELDPAADASHDNRDYLWRPFLYPHSSVRHPTHAHCPPSLIHTTRAGMVVSVVQQTDTNMDSYLQQHNKFISAPILTCSTLFWPDQSIMSELGSELGSPSAKLSTAFPVGKHRHTTMGKKSKTKELSIERKKNIAKNKKKRQLLDLKMKRDNDKKRRQQGRAKARDDKKRKK